MGDQRFRAELLSNPKAVIARELGVAFTANMNVQVLEETPRTMFLVLPSIVTDPSQLADAELDAVVGGKLREEAERAEKDAADTWKKIKGLLGLGTRSKGPSGG